MKKIVIFISTLMLITSFTLAQEPQKKEDKSAKKETKTEMTTTKVVHHCNPGGNTCVCGNNCKEGCCVTVADTKKPESKGTKSTTTKKETKESKPKKEENPPK